MAFAIVVFDDEVDSSTAIEFISGAISSLIIFVFEIIGGVVYLLEA